MWMCVTYSVQITLIVELARCINVDQHNVFILQCLKHFVSKNALSYGIYL